MAPRIITKEASDDDVGDCAEFNEIFLKGECMVSNGTKIGDWNYNTEGCNYGGGYSSSLTRSCQDTKLLIQISLEMIHFMQPDKEHNSKECVFDNGDCIELHQKYPSKLHH